MRVPWDTELRIGRPFTPEPSLTKQVLVPQQLTAQDKAEVQPTLIGAQDLWQGPQRPEGLCMASLLGDMGPQPLVLTFLAWCVTHLLPQPPALLSFTTFFLSLKYEPQVLRLCKRLDSLTFGGSGVY